MSSPEHGFGFGFGLGRGKRPTDYAELDSRRTSKRARLVAGPLDGFSKLERTTLQSAAEILEIPLERLLAASTTPTNTSRSDGFVSTESSANMQAASSNTKDSNASGESDQLDALETRDNDFSFALHLPTASERAKRREASRGGSVNRWLSQCQPLLPEPPELPELNTIAYQPQCEDSEFMATILTEPFIWGSNEFIEEDLPLIKVTEASETQAPAPWQHNAEPAVVPPPVPDDQRLHIVPTRKQKKLRGAFTDPKLKHETSLTRKLGACIRCKLQRLRCIVNPAHPEGCCQTCVDAARTMIHWFPCVRYSVTDVRLIDHGTCPRPTWTSRWKKMAIVEIDGWASEKTKTITITQDVAGIKYDIQVRKFIPLPGDFLARKWKTNGIEQSYECTPYGIANMKQAGRTLANFIDRTLGDQICYYIDESDGLLRKTYMMAYRYSNFANRMEERLLLRDVLRLWCGLRMESRSDRICGAETLGMDHKDYGHDCPNTGLILTSPVFSAQLEVIMTTLILTPARDNVLKRLKLLIEKKGRGSWFAIYLTLLVLLHSCSLLTAADRRKAQKQNMERQFFRPSLVEELHHGAKILLSYFHYTNKGGCVFAMDWSSADQLAWAEFDAEQIQFMQETSVELRAKANVFKDIRKKGLVEHDYYFLCQLYDSEWKL